MSIEHVSGVSRSQITRMYAAADIARKHQSEIDDAVRAVDDNSDAIEATSRTAEEHSDATADASATADKIALRATPPVSIKGVGALSAAGIAGSMQQQVAASVIDSVAPVLQDNRPSILSEAVRTNMVSAVRPKLIEPLGSPLVAAFRPAWMDFTRAIPQKAIGVQLPAVIQQSLASPALAGMVSIPAIDLGLSDIPSALTSMARSAIHIGQVTPSVGALGLGVTRFSGAMTSTVIPSYLQSVLPRIDLGVSLQVHGVASALAQQSVLTPSALHWNAITSGIASLSRSWTGELSEAISSLFGDWRTLADFGHPLAGTALGAALAARRAVLRGKKEVVRRFAKTWLRIMDLSENALDAVVAALLDDAWLEDDSDPVDAIKKLYKDQYRQSHRPVWETRLNGRRVGTVDLVVGEPGSSFDILSQIPAPEPAPYEWSISHPVAGKLVEQFSPQHQQVLYAYFSTTDKGMTWSDAALDCGLPASSGESVRRKFKKLSARLVGVSG